MGCGTSKTDGKENESGGKDQNKNGDNQKNTGGKNENEEEEDAETKEKRNKFEQAALEAHNKYRAKHGAPALTLNRELCDIAKKWAKRLAADKAFKHSEKADRKCKNGNTGENLYYSGTTGDLDVQGTAPVDSWYGEIKDYNFDKPSFAQNTAHFTQVVWEKSEEFGIAFATYEEGDWNKVVVVANYYPAGNIMKAFDKNVKKSNDENCNDNKNENKNKKEKEKEKEEKKPEKKEKEEKPSKKHKKVK